MLFIHSSILLFVILFMTGLVAGLVDAIAGGGGLVSVPMLLGVGMPPHLALGTNKLQSMCGTSVAAYSYYRKGWIDLRKIILGLISSFIGAVIGAVVAQIVSGDILKKLIPLLLLVILLYTLFSPKLGNETRLPKVSEKSFYVIAGLILGFYDGFFGPGAGAFWTFFLMYFLGQAMVQATAYTKVLNLNTNISATVCFMLGNHVNYGIALCMAAGQVIGGRLGATLAMKKGVKLIRPIFLSVVFATILSLIYKNYFSGLPLSAFPHELFKSSGWIVASVVVVIVYFLRAKRQKHVG